jgi:hypothetical protein
VDFETRSFAIPDSYRSFGTEHTECEMWNALEPATMMSRLEAKTARAKRAVTAEDALRRAAEGANRVAYAWRPVQSGRKEELFTAYKGGKYRVATAGKSK